MTHKAKVIGVEEVANGILAVRVRCCGDPSTEEVLSLHQLHRSEAELDADIAAHVEKVQKMHANRDFAKAHVERLMKK